MILHSLANYYEQLVEKDEKGEIPLLGYNRKKVGYVLLINKNGELLDIISNTEEKEVVSGKKTKIVEVAKEMLVPHFSEKRTSGIKPYFLCDRGEYILGIKEENFEACKKLHIDLLGQMDSEIAKAVVNFFKKWDIKIVNEHSLILEKMSNDKNFVPSNFIFMLDEGLAYPHEDPAIRRVWESYLQEDSKEDGLCLITGEIRTISRTHPVIKGLLPMGGQASGNSLVGYNAESFKSFGKEQAYNSPVSEFSAFAYTEAANWLLKRENNHMTQLGNTAILFWSEQRNKVCDDCMSFFLNQTNEDEYIKGVFEHVLKGQIPDEMDLESKFYILGISPNAARVSVRFFMQSTFGDFIDNIKRHVGRLEIARPEKSKAYLSPWELAIEIVRDRRKDKPTDDLAVGLLKSVLNNSPYPIALIHGVLTRIKADINSSDENTAKYAISYRRAGIIKAYLLRQNIQEKEMITVALNENWASTSYCLGRLFAVCEKIQEDSNSGNTTMKSRYFASASATPASIFPSVIKLADVYLQKSDYRVYFERLLGSIMNMLEAAPFPKNLSFEEQNIFILGYYHQRQALFTSKKKEEEN